MERKTYGLIVLIAITNFTCRIAEASDDMLPTLKRSGKVTESSCTFGHLRELRRSLLTLKVRDHFDLWVGIRLMLCEHPTPANTSQVAKMLARKIHTTVEGTGQVPNLESISGQNVPMTDLFAKGYAFDAMAERADKGITISYSLNEACIESRSFAYVNKSWKLVSMGQACD